MWKTFVELGRPHKTTRRTTLRAGQPVPHTITLTIYNNHFFPTATMIARTYLSITVYVHWLSCLMFKTNTYTVRSNTAVLFNSCFKCWNVDEITFFVECLSTIWPPRFRLYLHKIIFVQQAWVSVNNTISIKKEMFNPSAWGHLNPSSYCDVGRLFYGVFKLWSKLQRKK